MTPRRLDSGFTLIELLLSITILGIILSAITGALVAFLSNSNYAIERDDHSGGAALLSSYLDRDLASADTVTGVGTPCSGAGSASFTLKWTEWSASTSAPSPAPSGGTWQASYVVGTDPSAPAGTTRYQLERRLCPPTGAGDTTVVIRGLQAGSAGQAVPAPTPTTSTSCPSPATEVTVRLPAYATDDASQGFSYSGCVRARTP